jgi:hypothetical protein
MLVSSVTFRTAFFEVETQMPPVQATFFVIPEEILNPA